MDWYSRRVLAWRLSTTLDTAFCVDAVEEAIGVYGAPDIFDTDHRSEFTNGDFSCVLKQEHISTCMDGRGLVAQSNADV